MMNGRGSPVGIGEDELPVHAEAVLDPAVAHAEGIFPEWHEDAAAVGQLRPHLVEVLLGASRSLEGSKFTMNDSDGFGR